MVRTKAYTLSLLIKEVRSLKTKDFTTFATFAIALSPRAGTKSAKIKVLNNFLNGDLKTFALNKKLLLSSLKVRKENRTFFS